MKKCLITKKIATMRKALRIMWINMVVRNRKLNHGWMFVVYTFYKK
jgi:hypothetical protein